MNILTSRTFQSIVLALTLCAILFVGLSAQRAVAVTNAGTSVASQLALIEQLLAQVKQLQATLAKMQASGNAGQKGTCLELKNDLGYRSADGITGGDVSALQDYLQAKGFLNSAPTGFYGLMTSEAVKSFQAQHGIDATGYVGDKTRGKIKTLTCTNPGVTPPIACTMDVKMCPDGSYVGRVAPSCNFAACPSDSAQIVKTPSISRLSPSSVYPGGSVTIYGSNFNDTSMVYIGSAPGFAESYPVNPTSYTEKTLTFTVRPDHSTGWTWDMYVTNGVFPTNYKLSNKARLTISEEIPKITSAEFFQSAIVGEPSYLRIWGSDLGNVAKLEYQATSEQPLQTVRGVLSAGMIEKDSYASFGIDAFLGNAIIRSLKVRVVDNQGNASEWEDVEVGHTYNSPSISITSPNEGMYWFPGQKGAVEWSTMGIPSTNQVLIRLRSVRSEKEYDLVTTANDGFESFSVPTDIPVGSYYVEVKTSFNGKSYSDSSDEYIKLVVPSITLISPNDGMYWYLNKSTTINWETLGIPSSNQVLIRLRGASDPGKEYNLVTSINDGSELIPAPDGITGAYYVEVKTSFGGKSYSDSSDEYIKIVDPETMWNIPMPAITMFKLSADTFTRDRDTVTVSWSTNTNTANCSIYRKESNGGLYTIASNVGSATSYTLHAESLGQNASEARFVLSCLGRYTQQGRDYPTAEREFQLAFLPQVIFDQNLSALGVGPTITGTAYGISGSLGFSLSSMSSSSGDKVWGSGTVYLSGGKWSITIPSSVERGEYQLNVYSDNNLIKAVIIDIGLRG